MASQAPCPMKVTVFQFQETELIFFVSRHPTEESMSCQILNFSFSLERETTAATNYAKLFQRNYANRAQKQFSLKQQLGEKERVWAE